MLPGEAHKVLPKLATRAFNITDQSVGFGIGRFTGGSTPRFCLTAVAMAQCSVNMR